MEKRSIQTKTVVLAAVLTALVIVMQFMGSAIRFGKFSISLVLVPIVIGAATCGRKIGAWLGLVFGIIVLASGDAGDFLVVNAPGTVVTVLVKGILAGYLAGFVYSLFAKYNKYLATATAAVVCPLVNTGIFLIGCRLFFMETVSSWAMALGYGEDVVKYMFLGLAGGNFVFELILNIVVSPVIVRLINIREKQL